ncbi:Pimeloyl-ACP methyl ester carboxylesterase [Duganella sp. CF402]|uniref:epoxide hydrolase family protein n=1 Tax=unclassified Duganella TaxID=2636909 RepID=UPI0008C67CFE|nr:MULTISPECIES: epoxide hydrolase [unclassified Duganella]RZT08401.1 pimeloyl-ACP methyl ester carboxylesterase [Duganella sp. BK701]SEL95293.1 Pimeloyl-ACP methyl ester carboxylesterase [Duganella sp. CF402]
MQASIIQPARRAFLAGKPSAARRAAPQGLILPPASAAITPFRAEAPQALLDDLKLRLSMTRWPDRETGTGWSQGVPLQRMKALVQHWQQRYDWRRAEAKLNAFPQFRTEIDGLGIHFLHVRSKHENALPLILTHGWPGSVFEFLKVIGPLVDPTAHGGKAEDAFHVVVPSLPGFGFSDKPAEKGWNVVRIAKAWGTLMARLGYSKWAAQGGDWGAGVTTALGHIKPAGLAGIHLNWQFVFPEKMPATLSPDEQRAVDGVGRFLSGEYGYFNEQATRPQTVGEVLSSTPVGQAAWIYEKFQAWTDNGGDVENVLTRDEMLDDISLYWLTNTAASSARIYWENSPSSFSGGRLDLPVAVSVFPKEIYRAPRSWAEATYPQMIYWNEVERGGHFAAFEQPALFVAELRTGFAKLR